MWKRGENEVILMGRAGKDAEVRYTQTERPLRA